MTALQALTPKSVEVNWSQLESTQVNWSQTRSPRLTWARPSWISSGELICDDQPQWQLFAPCHNLKPKSTQVSTGYPNSLELTSAKLLNLTFLNLTGTEACNILHHCCISINLSCTALQCLANPSPCILVHCIAYPSPHIAYDCIAMNCIAYDCNDLLSVLTATRPSLRTATASSKEKFAMKYIFKLADDILEATQLCWYQWHLKNNICLWWCLYVDRWQNMAHIHIKHMCMFVNFRLL